MPLRFLNPNFHVILIHYPLGVFVMGVMLELFSFMWPRGSARPAGRWMILLGALSSIPAATSGIYALSDVAHHQKPIVGVRYQQLYWHVVLQGIATLLAVFVAGFGLAASDRWRRKLYPLFLLGLLGALGVFVVGSWHGGETVYDKGTAVRSLPSTNAPADGEASDTSQRPQVPLLSKKAIGYYLGGIVQIHMITAGVAFAVAMGALALSVRKITSTYPDTPDVDPAADRNASDAAVVHQEEAALLRSFEPVTVPPPVDPPLYPAGRFWLLATLVVFFAALGGLWIWANHEGTWSLGDFWKDIMLDENKQLVLTRVAVHVWVGLAILLFTLVLAGLARWAGQRSGGLAIFGILIVVAMAAQVWLGVLLGFDNREGSLFRFNPAEVKQQQHQETGLAGPSPRDSTHN